MSGKGSKAVGSSTIVLVRVAEGGASPGVEKAFQDLRDAGATATALEINGDARRRTHALRNAVDTFRYAIDDVAQGYRFDDDLAAEKLQALRQALGALESELPLFIEVLRRT